jgi:hypothetical protein
MDCPEIHGLLGARTRDAGGTSAGSLAMIDPSRCLIAAALASLLAVGPVLRVDPVHAAERTGRWDIDFDTRYEVSRWLHADYDLSYADPNPEYGRRSIMVPPTPSLAGGLTLGSDDGFSAGGRVQFLDDPTAAPGYFVLNLLMKYRSWNVEASLFAPDDPFGVRAGFELSF